MKTLRNLTLAATFSVVALMTAAGQQADSTKTKISDGDVPADASKTAETPEDASNAALKEAGPTPTESKPRKATPADGMLRLNFRGVPIDMVLDYLSDAAGFIIVKETEVKGKVDVWSNQPVTKDEAVELLNMI